MIGQLNGRSLLVMEIIISYVIGFTSPMSSLNAYNSIVKINKTLRETKGPIR